MATTPYSTSQIQDYAKQAGYWDPSKGLDQTKLGNVYQDASKNGISADQLDTAFGLSSGTAAKYISDQGWAALPGSGSSSTGTGGTSATGTGSGSGTETPDTAGMLAAWYKDYMSKAPTTNNAASSNATAASWTPNEQSTVQGQLKGILDAGGPLMDRATTRALQQMNDRGLLNSSMAVGAGQAALYDAATPIAAADAATYAKSLSENAGYTQAANLQNANNATDVSKFNAGAANTALEAQRASGVSGAQQAAGFAQQTALQKTDIAAQKEMQAADLGSRYDLANLDAATRTKLAEADYANQQKLQASDQIFKSNLQTQSLNVQQSMQTYDAAVKQAMQGKDNDTKLAIATLDASTQEKVATINNQYKTQLQTSASMSNTYSQYMASIAQVMADPNMDAMAKTNFIDTLTKAMQANLDLQSTISGIDLGKLITQPDTSTDTSTSTTSSGTGTSGTSSGTTGGTAGGTTSDQGFTCFPAGSMVLMGDGTERTIETIEIGDLVMGWNGPTPVIAVDKPRLGDRQMMQFSDGHRWSDEHPHWSLGADGTQWWWAANKPNWVREVEAGAIGGLFDNATMRTGNMAVAFAHIDGWKTELPMAAHGYEPDTQLYLPRTGGIPIVIDGYVVSGGTNQWEFDYTGLRLEDSAIQKVAA